MRIILLALLFFTVSGFSKPSVAQDQATKVKAVFLFKFFDYVTWPNAKDPQKTGDGVLCVYGVNAFGDTLNYIAKKKSNGVRYRVLNIDSLAQIKHCHIIYVAKDHFDETAEFPNNNVLTVSDRKGFVDHDGIIEIKEYNGRIKISIHLEHAKKHALKISSKLLKIAEVIQ